MKGLAALTANPCACWLRGLDLKFSPADTQYHLPLFLMLLAREDTLA
jgi:hypothetical protein